MREYFKQQLEHLEFQEGITEEQIQKINSKKTHLGKEIKVGDKLLFGLTSELKNDGLHIELVSLFEEDIDFYELDEKYRKTKETDRLPIIKLK